MTPASIHTYQLGVALVESLTDAAEAAFWATLADIIPADTGDLDPALALAFRTAARRAVENWLILNAPTAAPDIDQHSECTFPCETACPAPDRRRP